VFSQAGVDVFASCESVSTLRLPNSDRMNSSRIMWIRRYKSGGARYLLEHIGRNVLLFCSIRRAEWSSISSRDSMNPFFFFYVFNHFITPTSTNR